MGLRDLDRRRAGTMGPLARAAVSSAGHDHVRHPLVSRLSAGGWLSPVCIFASVKLTADCSRALGHGGALVGCPGAMRRYLGMTRRVG